VKFFTPSKFGSTSIAQTNRKIATDATNIIIFEITFMPLFSGLSVEG
jgi:hypothetical protein